MYTEVAKLVMRRGLTEAHLAGGLGVPVYTVHYWIKTKPNFAAAVMWGRITAFHAGLRPELDDSLTFAEKRRRRRLLKDKPRPSDEALAAFEVEVRKRWAASVNEPASRPRVPAHVTTPTVVTPDMMLEAIRELRWRKAI